MHDENPKKEEKLELTLPPEICRNFLGFQMLERNLIGAFRLCFFCVRTRIKISLPDWKGEEAGRRKIGVCESQGFCYKKSAPMTAALPPVGHKFEF